MPHKFLTSFLNVCYCVPRSRSGDARPLLKTPAARGTMPLGANLFIAPSTTCVFLARQRPCVSGSRCHRHRRSSVYHCNRRAVITGAQLSADDGPQQPGVLAPHRSPKTLLRIRARRPVWTYVVRCRHFQTCPDCAGQRMSNVSCCVFPSQPYPSPHCLHRLLRSTLLFSCCTNSL